MIGHTKITSQRRPEYTNSAIWGEGSIKIDNSGAAGDNRECDPGVSGCLEYHQEVGYHPSHPGPRVWVTMALDYQVLRGQDDFFGARSSLTPQTLEKLCSLFLL